MLTKKRETNWKCITGISHCSRIILPSRLFFAGTRRAAEEIDEQLEASQEKRRTSQPAARSAGCIFKNPDSCPAGKLVDELGLKNSRVGNARVSEVHGNFIVNDGGASACRGD